MTTTQVLSLPMCNPGDLGLETLQVILLTLQVGL